jgi:hypothetical protein
MLALLTFLALLPAVVTAGGLVALLLLLGA